MLAVEISLKTQNCKEINKSKCKMAKVKQLVISPAGKYKGVI